MEKDNKYYSVIEEIIRQHKKFAGCEAILDDIIDDVYAHSEVIINSIANESVIKSYLEKVVSTSIITVPKKMNFHPEIKHKVISTLPQIENILHQQTATPIEQVVEKKLIEEPTAENVNQPVEIEELEESLEELIQPETTESVEIADSINSIEAVETVETLQQAPTELVDKMISASFAPEREDEPLLEIEEPIEPAEEPTESMVEDVSEAEEIAEITETIDEKEEESINNSLEELLIEEEDENNEDNEQFLIEESVETQEELNLEESLAVDDEAFAEVETITEENAFAEELTDTPVEMSEEISTPNEIIETIEDSTELIETDELNNTDDLALEIEESELDTSFDLEEGSSVDNLEEISFDTEELLEEDTNLEIVDETSDVSEQSDSTFVPTDYSKFDIEIDSVEDILDKVDADEISSEILKLNEKRPELHITDVYQLKYKKNHSVAQITQELEMSESDVLDALGEIIALI